ncbi:MAG TPA: electron transfer flavoprotein subunit alpha/FixB family protein [Anaerovoracaceae bacterium]|nr:electron transfer flavoprotein subunit alpha/FixB family protein [Anaerovoracaceae bacterium]
MKNKKILIYAELKNSRVQNSSLELLTKARQIFREDGTEIAFTVAGDDVGEAVKELSASGADAVYVIESGLLKIFNIDYYSAALMNAVKEFAPDVLLISATTFGEELAPTLGVKLKTGAAAHCVDLKVNEEGNFIQMVPAFGGKVIGEIMITKAKPQIASVKPGMFSAEKQEARDCRVVWMDGGAVETCPSKIRAIKVSEREPDSLPLENAEVVICGGVGVGSKENWDDVITLARLLGGAAGNTRPAVDEGWVDDEQNMIGTSGKTLRPKVYVGVGVSGATHHVCGMKDSGVVISVNSDLNAEIFKVSDYKAVADGPAVVKELIGILKNQPA